MADASRVYVSSVIGAPLKALDAATGKEITTYAETNGAREFVKVGDAILMYRERPADKGRGQIVRLDSTSGAVAWASRKDTYKGESLAASGRYVIYHNRRSLVCLNAADGKELWRTPQGSPRRGRGGQATYIIHGRTVLEGASSRITAWQAGTGKVLWKASTGGRAMRGHDTFVARGLVWHAAGNNVVGYDLTTGRPARTIDPASVQSDGHHLRCHRAKATEQYLITQYRGVEFISITGKAHSQTDWARGACSFGVVPANGLLYVPPNPCFCYPGVKIKGFNALRPIDGEAPPPAAPRLHKGPAYGKINLKSKIYNHKSMDWPTYRHDPMRHGTTRTAVGDAVAVRWKAKLPGPVSPPVMAQGRVYVAAKDEHTLYALDADTGKTVWRFTAGARIDSPPTLHAGTALFGCADGRLYCVTADKGELAWTFRAAPADRRIMVCDQLESVWPVHGSVLVRDGVVYCTAGRSSMLDGGVRLFGLNPGTGEVLHEARVDTLAKVRPDARGNPVIPSYNMRGAHADILVSEAGAIYMGPAMFDLRLKRLPTPAIMDVEHKTVGLNIEKAPYIQLDPELQRDGYENFRAFHRYQERAWPQMTAEYMKKYGGMNLGDWKMGRDITPTAGFLDGAWFNRTYWMYSDKWPGWYHAHRGAKTGQLLAVGPERTYALQAFPYRNRQSPLFEPGGQGYLLFADANDNEPVLDFKTRGATKGIGYTRMKPPVWYDWISIRVRGMVAAGDALFVAGPPDVVPKADPMAAFEGRKGAVLRAVSTKDGKVLSECTLASPPVFDGLIAAGGHLFMSTEDHHVVCLAGAKADAEARAKLQAAQAERLKKIEAAAAKRTFGRGAKPAGKKPPSGTKGKRLPAAGRLPRGGWKIARASSVERSRKEFAPARMLDGNPMTSWHSRWAGGRDPFPHEIVVDLGKAATCREIHYLPRQDRAQNGRVKDYALYASRDGKAWGKPVAKGAFENAVHEQRVAFKPVSARYVRLVILSGYDENLSAIAELNVIGGGR